MRSESLINNMMQPSPFSEFNPLDVLATAASLQSARIETDDEISHNNDASESQDAAAEKDSDEDKDGDLKDLQDVKDTEVSSPCEEHVTESPVEGKPETNVQVKSPSDDAVFQVPAVKHVKFVKGVKESSTTVTNGSKPVTVLRVYKPQMTDHSYAFMFQLQSLKNDEDEGYSSRSSIDEEGEDVSSTHGSNVDTSSLDGLQSPTTPRQGKFARNVIIENCGNDELPSPKKEEVDVETVSEQPDVMTLPQEDNVETQNENSSHEELLSVSTDVTAIHSEMPEESTTVISLHPESVLDALAPPVAETDTSILFSSVDAVSVIQDQQNIVENAVEHEETSVEANEVNNKEELNMTIQQGETDASCCSEVALSTESMPSDDADVADANGNENTSYNDASCDSDKLESNEFETNVEVTESDADKSESDSNSPTTDKSQKNQYIIEDDISPVRKFGSTEVESEKDVLNVAQLADRNEGTVLVVSKPENKNAVRQVKTQSLLKTSNIVGKTNSSVVRVIPFVNGGRVTQILPRPVQCVTPVKGHGKTIMKVTSPCVEVKKPPTLGKLLMPVATTALSSTKGIILKSPVPSPTAAISSPAVSTDTSLSGRSTPKSIPDTDSVDSDVSPTLKVTMMSGDSDLNDKEKVKVEKTSIGTVGSLSWKPFGGGLIQLGANSRSKEFIRIQGSQIQPREPSEDEAVKEDDLSVSLSPNPWAGSSLETASMDDVLSVTNSDDSMLSEPSVMSPVVPLLSQSKRRSKTDKFDPDSRWERCSELHPLIDHDYCMFTEFNAQIQSSIIATTESKTRIDRRYNKKTKSARTKSASLIFEPDKPLRGRPSEKVLKGKKGRLKKKDVARGAYSDDNSNVDMKPAVHSKESEEKALKRQMRLEKKQLAEKKKAERNDRNFVKITGSYKDEFVYYATRNYRRIPRKAPEPAIDPSAKLLKPIPAGGVNDFDWYRDLSKADKTSYFSSPGLQSTESSRHTSPSALPIAHSEDALMDKRDAIPGSTPIHESDVVDLVCELSGYGGDTYSGSSGGGIEVSTTESTEQPTNGDSSLDLNQMAEHVCSMLTSLDENGLLLLEKLGEDSADEKPAGSGLNDTSFDGFLGAPVQGQTQLCDDLDEINDNDLLTTDISTMNDMSDILTDLRSSATAQTTTSVDGSSVQAGTSNVSVTSAGTPNSFMSEKLDRAELFPDIHAPTLQNRSDATVVPELTVVSMFWNDLPGLIISSVQHVRLVDIHKQVLPAKDTGILKKRCQMLGLDIANCSELQRDFLIRYANAAKSKSTVIVSKKAAEELIGFYVNPKPRGSRHVPEDKEEAKQKGDAVNVTLPAEGSSTQSEVSPSSQPLDQLPPATPTNSSSSRSADSEESIPQSRSGKKSRKRKLTGDGEINPGSPGPVLNVSALDTSSGSITACTTPAQDVKRSERLRHKKVRYADMANGTAYLEGAEDDEDSKPSESLVVSESSPSLPASPVLEQDDSGLSSDHENRDITLQKLVYPEEQEIKRIRLKARKKKLTKQEKRRLKRLKERLQKKAMKQKMEKKRMKLLQRQKTSAGGKGKRRLQETHAYTKKVNPEHCYAACPAVKEEKVDAHPIQSKEEIDVKEIKEEPIKEEPKAPLAVIHRDNVHRQGTARVGRWQDGEVYLSLYRNKDSRCIQCMTCRDFYTVRRFLKHMHKQNNPDELLEVNLPQKFELRNSSPTDGETQDWQEFQTKRRLVDLSPNERTRKTPSKPADNNTPQPSEKVHEKDKETPLKNGVDSDPPVKADSEIPTTDNEKQTHIQQEQKTPVKAGKEKEVNVEIHLKADPRPDGNKASPVTKTESSPDDNGLTRHSTRVRKRKQLHPIESYVYSKLLPANGKPEKREDLPAEIDKVSMAVSPVRATKFKVSVRKDGSSQVTRLDLKVPGPEKRLAKRARYSQ